MANFDGYGKYEEVELSSFGGLDRAGPLCGGKSCFELRNMRVTPKGGLARREGYAPFVPLPGTIRNVRSLERGEENELYAVADDKVYLLSSGVQPKLLGRIGTKKGKVRFFGYDRKLLLMDGQQIWVLTPQGITPVQPYIPLYGKDWEIGSGSELLCVVHEPPNVLCNRLRIRFSPVYNVLVYTFGNVPVTNIEQIYVNGVPYERMYFFDEEERTLKLSDGYDKGTSVEVIVTVEDGFCGDRTELVGASGVSSVGDAEKERLLFYGGSVPMGCVYMSRLTDVDEYTILKNMQPDVCALYLSDQDKLTLGDGLHAVTGACRHFDRSLVFTDGMTWMADGSMSESGKLQLIPINTSMGCSSEGAYTVVGNEPITVMGRRVLRWNSKTDERNECNAEVISSEVEPLFDADFGKKAQVFTDAQRGEVWFYVPGKQGRILIRNEQQDSWTSFDGFTPNGVFNFGEYIGFFEGQMVYLFDPEAYYDKDKTGEIHGIEAEFMSAFQDFGHAGRVKRPVGATVIASCENGRAQLVLQHVSGRERVVPLRGDGNEISVMQARTQSGRFRYLRIGLRCSDVREWKIHGIHIKVR